MAAGDPYLCVFHQIGGSGEPPFHLRRVGAPSPINSAGVNDYYDYRDQRINPLRDWWTLPYDIDHYWWEPWGFWGLNPDLWPISSREVMTRIDSLELQMVYTKDWFDVAREIKDRGEHQSVHIGCSPARRDDDVTPRWDRYYNESRELLLVNVAREIGKIAEVADAITLDNNASDTRRKSEDLYSGRALSCQMGLIHASGAVPQNEAGQKIGNTFLDGYPFMETYETFRRRRYRVRPADNEGVFAQLGTDQFDEIHGTAYVQLLFPDDAVVTGGWDPNSNSESYILALMETCRDCFYECRDHRVAIGPNSVHFERAMGYGYSAENFVNVAP